MRALALLVLVLSSVPVVVAHGADLEVVQHDIDERFALFDRGSVAELNVFARAGDEIRYDVTTDARPIYFDIHAHTIGGLETFVTENATSAAAGTFTAPADGDYSIFLERNENGTAQVRLQVMGRFAVESVSGFTLSERNAAPAVAWVPVALALLAVAAARRR